MLSCLQRESGEGRTYEAMWRRYKRRILLAMSSQAFAQLVRHSTFSGLKPFTDGTRLQNGINGKMDLMVKYYD